MVKEAIIIFTRVPIEGKTKTRLMPVYTSGECVDLHVSFFKDVLEACKETKRDIFIYYTPEGFEDILRSRLGYDGSLFLQVGDTLGIKMFNAISEVLNRGYDSCILVGSDIPSLKMEHLLDAFLELKKVDVVFGPTVDKGYYLVGMKKPIEVAFFNQTYGEGSVLNNAITALDSGGYSVSLIEELRDIDTSRDLIELRKVVDKSSHTGRYLFNNRKISVIIPVYNEEGTIESILRELDKLSGCEIIFVDGGSSDGTVELIGDKYRVIRSSKGRGNQLNVGAKASSGDVLFFLHCDSVFPDDPIGEIREVIGKYKIGCFGLKFSPSSPLLAVIGLFSNLRVKTKRIAFGDQGIFIDRELFFKRGMFLDIPIMEDYDFFLRLKRNNKRINIGMTKNRLTTSSRRFSGNSVKVILKMKKLQRMYRKNVSIEVILNEYKDVR